MEILNRVYFGVTSQRSSTSRRSVVPPTPDIPQLGVPQNSPSNPAYPVGLDVTQVNAGLLNVPHVPRQLSPSSRNTERFTDQGSYDPVLTGSPSPTVEQRVQDALSERRKKEGIPDAFRRHNVPAPPTRADDPTFPGVLMNDVERAIELQRQGQRSSQSVRQSSYSRSKPTPSSVAIPRSTREAPSIMVVAPTNSVNDLPIGRPSVSTRTKISSKHSRPRTVPVEPSPVVEPQLSASPHNSRTTNRSNRTSHRPVPMDVSSSNPRSHNRTVSGLIPSLEGLGLNDRSREFRQSVESSSQVESRSRHSTRNSIRTAPEIVQFSSPIDISRITIQKNRALRSHEVIFNTTSKLLEHGSDVKVRTFTGPGRFSAPDKYEFFIHNNYCQAGSKLHLTVAIPQS